MFLKEVIGILKWGGWVVVRIVGEGLYWGLFEEWLWGIIEGI